MNIRLLSAVLAGALVASGAPALAHDFTAVEVYTTTTPASTYTYTSPSASYTYSTVSPTVAATSPQVVYIESTPRVVYVDGTARYYDADGNRVYPSEVYTSNWFNRHDAFDRSGRGMSPAEVSNLTHNVDSTTSGVPWNGSGAQAGNMGPSNSKGQ